MLGLVACAWANDGTVSPANIVQPSRGKAQWRFILHFPQRAKPALKSSDQPWLKGSVSEPLRNTATGVIPESERVRPWFRTGTARTRDQGVLIFLGSEQSGRACRIARASRRIASDVRALSFELWGVLG